MIVIFFGGGAGCLDLFAETLQSDELVVFYSVATLDQDDTAPALIGGRPANTKDFPASLYSVSLGKSCTATLIGPSVVLTAAHCIGSNKNISIEIGGVKRSALCEVAPHYETNNSADWALCALDNIVESIAYEHVNLDAALIRKDDQVLLSGFGCTQNTNTKKGFDGVYRIGEAKIVSTPSSSNNYYAVKGDATLCFGDSGGAAFFYLPNGRFSDRTVVSVNSVVGASGRSYLSSTSVANAIGFLSNWSKKHGMDICGLSHYLDGCRSH